MLLEHQKTAMLYLLRNGMISKEEAASLYRVSVEEVSDLMSLESIKAAPAAGMNHPTSNKEHQMPTATLRAVDKVRPEHMSLYPTMDSCPEAIAYIEQQAPLNTPTEIFSALMLYHNTLLKQLSDTGQLKN